VKKNGHGADSGDGGSRDDVREILRETAAIQRQQAKILRQHSELLIDHEKRMAEHGARMGSTMPAWIAWAATLKFSRLSATV
jgi:hypothetical protein